MRKIKNPWLHKDGYDCFGCSRDSPIGLHMEFFEDGDDIISFWRPQEHFQGWVGTMHGGILATIMDEAAGWVVTRKLQTAGMTTKLELRFKHPVLSSDSQLTIKAHITEKKHNMVFISVLLFDSNGVVCVEADAVYYAMNEKSAKEMGFSHCGVEDEQLFSM